jgi:O-glycosyl hydrolase
MNFLNNLIKTAMKQNQFTLCLSILFNGFLSLTASAQSAIVQVYPDLKQQIIQSIGGNYCQANYTNHAWDAIGQETLQEFRPSHVRVALPLKLRGMKFENYKGENFVKQPLIIEVLESLKRMKNEFGVQNFTISVWNVPDELVVDPLKSSQRVIKPEAYDEVIQMLVDFLLKAKNEYGVEVNQFSFNESDGGYQILFSSEATIAFIEKAGEKFEELGLKTGFLWADTAQTKGTVEFATQIMADPKIRKFIGPLSFHCWWSENIPDKEFERIAALAKAWNKEVWCAEMGFDAMAHKVKDMNKSWEYGLRFAKISHRIIKYAEVEVSLYWTWQNNYAIMSEDLTQKYPSYYVTRHLTEFLNTGTQIVQSTSSDPEILALAGVHPDGSKVLQIINLKKQMKNIEVKGFSAIKIDQVITTEVNNWEIIKNGIRSKNGKVLLQLKPQSINSFVLR